MTKIDAEIQSLVINKLTEAQYKQAKNNSEINENELYLTIDDVNADSSKAGSSISLSINPNTYVMTLQLKDADGGVISEDTVDLPLETMVVNANYNNTTKEITLTLQNGSTTSFSVADLVSGLAKISDIPTKVSQLTNDSGFLTSVPEEYAKTSNIPTKISQLTNDSGFLSSIPNASSTSVGGIKMRFDSATSTLYITNDGTNP